jgi:ABC-type sulfate transport system substrate-binding protein
MPIVDYAVKYLFDRFSVSLLSDVTGVAARSLYRYKSTNIIPSFDNYTKLYNRYRSVQYTALRAAGASTRQANRFKGASPDKVFQVIQGYQGTAIRLATEYELDVNDVIENMAKSEKDYEEINESP